MDDLDRKILSLLAKNARMPVKEIAEQISLTSPWEYPLLHKSLPAPAPSTASLQQV